jgi:hypothetical protein
MFLIARALPACPLSYSIYADFIQRLNCSVQVRFDCVSVCPCVSVNVNTTDATTIPVPSPASVALSLGARSMLDARSFMISTLRSQVGFAAAVAHARLRLSRLEVLIGGSGRTAGRYAVCRTTRLHFAPDRFRAGAGRRSGSGWRQVVGFAGGGLF